MQFVRRIGGQRPVSTALFVMAALAASACSQGDRGTGPVLPGNPPPNPQITRAAFLADVNVRTGEIKIRAPELKGTQGGLPASLRAGLKNGAPSANSSAVDFSMVGGDVVTLTSSNFVATPIGANVPGKVSVSFDINITNKLTGVQLVGPTVFPAPPPGTTGPLLFPFDIAVAVTSGGTATGGQGNDIIVTLPSFGLVAPSLDWNGAPWNFFNDVGCGSGSNDCFRFEEFAGPIFPGSTTAGQKVGFDLDPTVGQFTARLIVAADLQNSGPAPTGTVAGTVSSPQLGTLNGVTVAATSGITTLSGTTAGAGAYSIANVPTGPASIAITGGLPAGCTNPGAQSTTVTNGGTSTVNFSVTCPTPTGTVSGTISFTGATPSPTGISVVVTPTGGSAQPAVNPNAGGLYTRSAVPVLSGAGSVALSNLPSGCTNPGAGSYSGLTNGGTATVNFTIACTSPPAGYQYIGTAVDNGATVTISFSINMSTFDDPAISGPENIGVIDGTFTYPSSRLTITSCGAVAGSPLSPTTNTGTPGTVTFTSVNSTSAVAGQGNVGVITCSFTDNGTAGFSTVSSLFVASDFLGVQDYLAPVNRVIVTEATLP